MGPKMKNWGVGGDTLMVENRSPRVRNLSIISITKVDFSLLKKMNNATMTFKSS